MGAWNSARNYVERTLEIVKSKSNKVKYIGRKPSASTATALPSGLREAAAAAGRKHHRRHALFVLQMKWIQHPTPQGLDQK